MRAFTSAVVDGGHLQGFFSVKEKKENKESLVEKDFVETNNGLFWRVRFK